MDCGRRFALVYAVLAASLAGAGVLGWQSATVGPARAAPVRCDGPAGVLDPIDAAFRFLRGAVERDHPELAYRLVLPSARPGLSCARWTEGHIPFPRYRGIDWNRSSYDQIAGGTGQIVLRVILWSRVERPSRARFLLELQQDGRLWKVGFFDHE